MFFQSLKDSTSIVNVLLFYPKKWVQAPSNTFGYFGGAVFLEKEDWGQINGGWISSQIILTRRRKNYDLLFNHFTKVGQLNLKVPLARLSGIVCNRAYPILECFMLLAIGSKPIDFCSRSANDIIENDNILLCYEILPTRLCSLKMEVACLLSLSIIGIIHWMHY